MANSFSALNWESKACKIEKNEKHNKKNIFEEVSFSNRKIESRQLQTKPYGKDMQIIYTNYFILNNKNKHSCL